MLFQFQYIPIVLLTTVLVISSAGIGFTGIAFSQSSNQSKIMISLTQDSSPRFYECNVTPINGSSTLNGLGPDESAQNVLTDGNPNTGIMGDARFAVQFNEPLMNFPGPELKVVELSGVEPFNSSVVFNSEENLISVTPQSINETNSCNYSINEAFIDLQDLGIPEGSSVTFVNLDNLGDADTLMGADIGDISILQTGGNDSSVTTMGNDSSVTTMGNDSSVTTIDSQTIMLGGQSLPEGSFIHLYDSTPYLIENGHIAAKFPCNEENATAVDVLVGKAPNLAPADLEFIESLSTSGDLCLYHADISSEDSNPITDIAIQNNSTDDIEFPETSSIIVSVGSIKQ
jgi:hypothetical protein